MRVTQRMMYNGFVNNMQSSLSDYMESNIQGSSQKKINRPSDDPAGMALVLNTRRNIQNTTQYQRNVDTAKGWLSLADSTLTQVSTTLTSIKALAEQAATGTYTAENRQQIASQLRQMFGQLLNLSNTQFEGKSIFAGHKYTESAFDEALAVSTADTALQDTQFAVSGKSSSSIMLIFDSTGNVGGAADLNYRWTSNGGASWNNGTLPAGSNSISMNGVTLTVPNGTPVTAEDTAQPTSATNGTVLYIRPTAVYNGDDQGAQPNAVISGGQPGLTATPKGDFSDNVLFRTTNAAPVNLSTPGAALPYEYSTDNGATWTAGNATVPNPATGTLSVSVPGGVVELSATDPANPSIPAGMSMDIQPRRADIMGGSANLSANVQGTYSSNVLVRIDSTVDLATPGANLNYAYSTDNGNSWIKASTQTPTPADRSVRLPIPGGYMELSSPAGSADALTEGTQVMVHPDRADLNYEIMKDTYVSVNNVGKNIFGGLYNGAAALPAEQNVFEVVGKLIAYAENNNQQGISECLKDLTTTQEKILTETARIGGLENRLTMAKDVLSFEKLDQEERLSYTEDVDLTELLTRLAQQELAYNTVLKSTSMIMQLNLTKFL